MDLAIPYEQSFATLGIEMTQANDQLVCAVVPVRPTLLQPWVNVVSFSPDASRLASVGDDGMVRLWVSAKTHGGWSAWVPFSPDGGVAFSPTDAASPAPTTAPPCTSGTHAIWRPSRN